MLPTIDLAPGAENNGFGTMLAELMRENVQSDPNKERTFARMVGRVAFVVEDADVALTLLFEGGRVTVHDQIVGIPDVTIRSTSELLMKTSLVQNLPRIPLPDLRDETTRDVMRASFDGRTRIYGLLANIPLVLRLMRVLSVH